MSKPASPWVDEMPSAQSKLQIIVTDETGHSEPYVYNSRKRLSSARLKRRLDSGGSTVSRTVRGRAGGPP